MEVEVRDHGQVPDQLEVAAVAENRRHRGSRRTPSADIGFLILSVRDNNPETDFERRLQTVGNNYSEADIPVPVARALPDRSAVAGRLQRVPVATKVAGCQAGNTANANGGGSMPVHRARPRYSLRLSTTVAADRWPGDTRTSLQKKQFAQADATLERQSLATGGERINQQDR